MNTFKKQHSYHELNNLYEIYCKGKELKRKKGVVEAQGTSHLKSSLELSRVTDV